MRTSFWVGVAVMLTAFSVAAGDRSKKFSGEASVNVIEVPVRVFDPKTGEAVTGLTIRDFELFESGVRQEITNFSEIGATTNAQPSPARRVVAENAEGTRQMVFFFDLYLMMARDRDRALSAVADAYVAGIDSKEEISIVSFDGSLRTHLDRSREQRRLKRALQEVGEIKARGLEQTVSFTEALADSPVSGERNIDFYERRQRSREYIFELDRRVVRVGDALLATMARFARAEGRKVLVVFSPGRPATNWSPSYSPIDFVNATTAYPGQELWRKVALEASDLGFTLYIVDSSGLRSSSATEAAQGLNDGLGTLFSDGGLFGRSDTPRRLRTEDTAPGIEGGSEAPDEPRNLGQWLERTRKSLMISAAELTGGNAIFVADPIRALTEVKHQLEHWYSLAFTVESLSEGKRRSIEVRLPGRPDLRVVHRRAYVERTASARQAEQIRSAMLFGNDANPLGIRVEAGEVDVRFRLGAAGSKRVKVPLVVKIPIGRLDLVPRGDVYWGKVLITFFGTDQTGNQSRLASQEQPITVPADQFHRAAMSGYFTYKITVEVEGGEQTVYVGVKDLISNKVSIVPQEFDF
ncbi:MAG: VWA domain-containing protein [Thermoanaerobaculales bacterium]|nr:VWA domain-containing protein [Thermoanaerobaculales bacterium]